MPLKLNSIGPPIDRPIIPPRRPEQVGDFVFSPHADARPDTAPDVTARGAEGEATRRRLLELLEEKLQGS